MAEIFVTTVRFEAVAVQRLLGEWQQELVAASPGFSPSGGSTVKGEDFRPPRGAFVVATSGGTPVGCGGLRPLTATAGEVKRLFVRPPARGHGIGRILLGDLEEGARARGFRELRLDTGDAPAAQALFCSAGFAPIADYNGNPYARHWFGKRLLEP